MSRRSLRATLARQWAVSILLLCAGFAAMAVLGLFLLEDAFIDARLREVAADARADLPLPARFERIARADAPADLRAGSAGQRDGVIREFRLADGRYVHVLADAGADGTPTLLAYDVSDRLLVNAALARAWPWALAGAAALALLAWALARRFVAGVAGDAAGLVRTLADADAPARLHALADAQDVDEFAAFARHAAAAWEQRLAALERERRTLAFLGHELRTPLQSAGTSLALLADDRGNAAAWQRLQRAHARLARASQAILWLAADAAPATDAPCDGRALARALADEFAPLAAARAQTIRVDAAAGVAWALPAAVAETVLANLLLNAVRHGDAGAIVVAVDAAGLRVDNPLAAAEAGGEGGFGLGLALVERLLARAGWSLATARTDARFVVRAAPPRD